MVLDGKTFVSMEKKKQINHYLLFGFIFICAVLSRVVFTGNSLYGVTEDGSMVGLAALHWLDGSDYPLMSYGQAYLGSLEAIVAAFFFKLFGFNMFAFHLSPLLFALGFVIVVYFFGKDLGGEKFGLTAMAFAAVPAPFLAIWSVAIKGGYPETLFFGTLLLWLAWRMIERKSEKSASAFWIGVTAGLAWWCHPVSVYYLVPSALALSLYFIRVLKTTAALRMVFFGLTGFLTGSLPFWIYNIQNHFLSFAGGGGFHFDQMHLGIKNFFLAASPSVFHFSPLFSGIPGALFAAALVVLFGLSLLFLWKRTLFFLFFLSVLFFYSNNQFGISGEPRYILFLYSVIPFSLAWLCARLGKIKPFLAWLPVLLILPHNISLLTERALAHDEEKEAHKYLDEIYAKLDEEKIDRLVSVMGPILTVTSKEKIIASEPRNPRYSPHEIQVDAADHAALHHPAQYTGLESPLNALGISYQSLSNPWSTLYYNLQVPDEKLVEIMNTSWKGSSGLTPETVPSAFDRNLAWSWTASQLKQPGQTYTLDLGRKEPVRLIRLYNGFSFNYFPSGFKVEVSSNGKTWQKAAEINPQSYLYCDGGRVFWEGYHSRVECRLSGKPVRYIKLIQLGKSGNKIWQLNEIYCYKTGAKPVQEDETTFNQLTRFLEEKNAEFVYTNRNVSGKINLLRNKPFKALRPYSDKVPYAPDTSREVDFTQNWAFVLENEESGSTESLLKKRSVPFEKEMIGPYLVYYGEKMNDESAPEDWVWSGFSLLKNSYADAAPAILPKDSPDNGTQVIFEDKVAFLGFTFNPKNPQPGQKCDIRYYWKLLKPVQKDWAVFVHLEKENERFQNDHAFYHGTYPLKYWKPGQIVTETYALKIPEHFSPGEINIALGLIDHDNKKRRVPITQSSVAYKSRRAFVGKIPISSSGRSQN